MSGANFIKEWRIARGWSQEKLAAEATSAANLQPRPSEQTEPYSWGRTDVNRYENGKREPPLAFVRAVSTLFGCTINDLLGRRPTDPAAVPSDLKDVAPVWRDVPAEDREKALNVLKQFR